LLTNPGFTLKYLLFMEAVFPAGRSNGKDTRPSSRCNAATHPLRSRASSTSFCVSVSMSVR
jgi:hypothetical protein